MGGRDERNSRCAIPANNGTYQINKSQNGRKKGSRGMHEGDIPWTSMEFLLHKCDFNMKLDSKLRRKKDLGIMYNSDGSVRHDGPVSSHYHFPGNPTV